VLNFMLPKPPGCIVVMEDIDVGLANGTAIINREEAAHGQAAVAPVSRITLSGLLNAIVSASTGDEPCSHLHDPYDTGRSGGFGRADT
jgi:hypothetical protein